MKKTFFLLLIFFLMAGGVYFLRFKKETAPPQIQTPTKLVQKSVQQPISIDIPAINVNADVEFVGLDNKNNMDVPKKAEDVGWYKLGPKPGEMGSAVIAGHLDDTSGEPAVFWNIKKLTPGDKIHITDASGKEYAFTVTSVVSYPWDKFPLQKVFADTNGKKLNLITCGGSWDRVTKNYSQRTVVYAEIVE